MRLSVGVGLRDRITLGASGKISSGSDIVKRLIQGADFTNSARAMMMALGCIQAQLCQTDKCPVGVATQDKRRHRALVVSDKAERVKNFHESTVAHAVQIMAAMGIHDPAELTAHRLRKVISATETHSYAELYEWLNPGQLLDEPPETWAADWRLADPHSFHPRFPQAHRVALR